MTGISTCPCTRCFRTKRRTDQYAKAERHLKLIAENQDNWKKVRVFDSYLEP